MELLSNHFIFVYTILLKLFKNFKNEIENPNYRNIRFSGVCVEGIFYF